MLVVNVHPVNVDTIIVDTPVLVIKKVLPFSVEKVRDVSINVLVISVLPNRLLIDSFGTFNIFPLIVENRI